MIKVFGNKSEFELFAEHMIKPLQDDWVYLVWMVARKKYNSDLGSISRSEEMLARDILHYDDVKNMTRKLMRYGVDESCFIDRNTGDPIPQNCIAFYMDLTPKSMAKAVLDFSRDVMDEIWLSRTDNNRLARLQNPINLLFSKAHKCNAIPKPWIIIDVDSKDDFSPTIDILHEYNIPYDWVSETRGGYHIFMPRGEHLKIFHQEAVKKIKKMNVEVLNTCQTPIPGTYQGGFIVKRL